MPSQIRRARRANAAGVFPNAVACGVHPLSNRKKAFPTTGRDRLLRRGAAQSANRQRLAAKISQIQEETPFGTKPPLEHLPQKAALHSCEYGIDKQQ